MDDRGVGQLSWGVGPIAGLGIDDRRDEKPHLVVKPERFYGQRRRPRKRARAQERGSRHDRIVDPAPRSESSATSLCFAVGFRGASRVLQSTYAPTADLARRDRADLEVSR